MIYNHIAKLEGWKRKLILIFIDLNILIFAVWVSFWRRISNPYSQYFQNSLLIYCFGKHSLDKGQSLDPFPPKRITGINLFFKLSNAILICN